MEHFIVSARKYRPQVFEDVVGQQAITNTLENAIKSNHLAQALLFTGPRGVGKTTCARILAKRINQESLEKPMVDEDFAFNIFELDAASNNSVDDIRNLTDQVRIPPQTGKYKVYIIDEVHMLSQSAFNAFLKTLEEPPAHAIFILATTEKHKIIPTILSRCQIFDFKRIGVIDIKNYLHKIAKQENIVAEDDALHIIAQKADGALRDALSIFDRVVSFSGSNLTRQAVTENLNVLDYEVYFSFTDLLLDNNIPQILLEFNSVLDRGFDGHHFTSGLASHFRDLLVAKDPATVALLEVGDVTKKNYIKQAEKADIRFLLQAIDIANDCDLKYKTSKNQRLLVELTLMKIASITFDSQKKKSKHFIIPASHFISSTVEERLDVPENKIPEDQNTLSETSVLNEKSNNEYITTQNIEVKHTEITDSENKASSIVKPQELKTKPRRKSALSLSSIKRNKIEEGKIKSQSATVENLDNLPKDSFSEETFLKIWFDYIENLHQKGEKLFASILKADTPRIKNNLICVTYPNQLMKAELNKIKPKVLRHIRKTLNNYSIDFKITVNEENAKNFAYTPHEKYELLKSKNEAIVSLRKKFNLEL
ncbi:MAG: DNA polymerase III subunit gamma/tau [Flavobacteriaceae bacterium]|nr:DNA polymerase III subunit gamma/tau [Flavobacteriaceae bacterium]